MDWNLLILSVLLNAPFCLGQLLAQHLDKVRLDIPARGSLIPRSNGKRFLYWQDFLVQTWGDFIFLPLIAFGFFSTEISTWEIFLLVGIISVTIPSMVAICTHRTHKPDWGFPGGAQVSLGGAAHLPYFAIYLAFAIICLIRMLTGELAHWPLVLTLIGGAGYIALWMTDLRLGHFDKIN